MVGPFFPIRLEEVDNQRIIHFVRQEMWLHGSECGSGQLGIPV